MQIIQHWWGTMIIFTAAEKADILRVLDVPTAAAALAALAELGIPASVAAIIFAYRTLVDAMNLLGKGGMGCAAG